MRKKLKTKITKFFINEKALFERGSFLNLSHHCNGTLSREVLLIKSLCGFGVNGCPKIRPDEVSAVDRLDLFKGNVFCYIHNLQTIPLISPILHKRLGEVNHIFTLFLKLMQKKRKCDTIPNRKENK